MTQEANRDLVKELRQRVRDLRLARIEFASALLIDRAADEIERLRSQGEEGSGDAKLREVLINFNKAMDAFWMNRSNRNMELVCQAPSATEIKLEPGWLARDVARAAIRDMPRTQAPITDENCNAHCNDADEMGQIATEALTALTRHRQGEKT